MKNGTHGDGSGLLRELQELGFSDYEAKAYVSLLKVQPATAYEVSKDAGIPKANCYTVLESLSKKKGVQPISESPVRYIAVAPDILFERIASETSARCERIRADLKNIAAHPGENYVWSVTGSEAVIARIDQVIEEAKHHLWIKTSDAMLRRHLPALERAVGRGVMLRVILFGESTDAFDFGGENKVWLHEGNGIAVGLSPFLFTMARDYEEALIAEFRDASQASVTRNRAVVNLVDSLIRHEIYFAEIFDVFEHEISARFGPALLELRQKYLPPPQALALKSRLEEEMKVASAGGR